jgi:hypothetical protein
MMKKKSGCTVRLTVKIIIPLFTIPSLFSTLKCTHAAAAVVVRKSMCQKVKQQTEALMLIVDIDACSVAAEEKIMSLVWHAKIISARISSPSP